MTSIFEISIQRFFLFIVILKIASSILSLVLTNNIDLIFWIFAILIPLVLILLYVYIGYYRKDRSLTDEKFADSCYYMGFIFTISSIVISLFDLKDVSDNFNQIAFRFGAAMVSTVVGLLARVSLVSFKVDLNSAVTSAEDALMRGAQTFAARIEVATDQFSRFESKVTAATNVVEEHVRERVEKLSSDHSERLQTHFLFQQSELEKLVKTSQEKLNESSAEMEKLLEPLKTKVASAVIVIDEGLLTFQNNFKSRLSNFHFPDSYFADQLQIPMEALKTELNNVSDGILSISSEVKEASGVIGHSLKNLQTKLDIGDAQISVINGALAASKSAADTAEKNTNTIEENLKILTEIVNQQIKISNRENDSTESLAILKNSLNISLSKSESFHSEITATVKIISEAIQASNKVSVDLVKLLPALSLCVEESSREIKALHETILDNERDKVINLSSIDKSLSSKS